MGKHDLVDQISAVLRGRRNVFFSLFDGTGVCEAVHRVNAGCGELYVDDYETPLEELKSLPGGEELAGRIKSAVAESHCASEAQNLALGLAAGLLLAGESAEGVRARLRTFDLYPPGK